MSSRQAMFMALCHELAKASKCLSRHVGAVIVNSDGIILSAGYNGPPRKSPHCIERYACDENLIRVLCNEGINPNHYNPHHPEFLNQLVCPRRVLGYSSGERLDLCTASHAEANAIFQAANVGGASLKGSTIYLNTCMPCGECMKAILQAGIVEIVAKELVWYDNTSKFLAEQSRIKIRELEK